MRLAARLIGTVNELSRASTSTSPPKKPEPLREHAGQDQEHKRKRLQREPKVVAQRLAGGAGEQGPERHEDDKDRRCDHLLFIEELPRALGAGALGEAAHQGQPHDVGEHVDGEVDEGTKRHARAERETDDAGAGGEHRQRDGHGGERADAVPGEHIDERRDRQHARAHPHHREGTLTPSNV